ncbi:permease-like cell division protein FtsX [Virgibacillus halodenitrificans]|uniref:Cell division protein FtsX n=1 Tax=Virgibacillus halodenitrificans TaxID=1482 RepID=A0AAC9J234_VIRHA|nr:permease-like cell division protein FtsX [Virgibacillus halodenitrificans]APC49128.1 cell division protein FtsX [Virgibacillus halodenitrificans]MBD1223221.1 ABC transporter permease [Virgibacillus halodenitrificans]MCG1026858.1 permease-like cell division protein FtsX [Virgibacillus halodenitrificans]MCJ0932995.1 permease-like cell division protein FtsX [Virgibacillus halodenitrificans]MEC2160519.1 permease-like cell division protein FtsX [Virgibacillus halodenitrificans]
MKFRTVRRHLREGFKNIARNGWMTVASVGAVTTTLILVGAFLALMLNLNQMADNIEEDVEINALLELTLEEDQITTIGDEIKQINGVDSVVFSSKDEQLSELVDSMGEEGKSWQLFEQDNPLNHVYIIKTKDPQDTIKVADKISDLQGVQEVNYGQGVVERLFEFNKYARTIGVVLIVGLVFTAIFLISNTIKITIMARSREIGIMKLVGATNGFIRWPFFIEGLLLGILGSVVPIAAILGGYYYLENNISERINYSFVELLPFNPFAWQLSLIILGIGALIGVWGSVMSVRKFLKV